MARRTVQRGEVRRIVEANIIVDLGQQNAAEPFRRGVEARIFRTARLAETLDFFVDGALAGADLVTFNDSLSFTPSSCCRYSVTSRRTQTARRFARTAG